MILYIYRAFSLLISYFCLFPSQVLRSRPGIFIFTSTLMSIEKYEQSSVAIFLFAHQDDEFGVYEQIFVEQQRGQRIVCAYLTSGAPKGGDPIHRNRESLAVLGRLGVPANNVVFAGALLDIADGHLVNAIQTASDWMKPWLVSFAAIRAVYVPAWEGGHPDHDVLHAVTVQLCMELGIESRVRQFPLYNAFNCTRPYFHVLSPLKENGEVDRSSIPWRRRVRFLGYALSYPSQRTSWIGLFLFFFLHHMIKGNQDLQSTSASRIRERPHDGLLYYEHRRFSSWELLRSKLFAWLAAREVG